MDTDVHKVIIWTVTMMVTSVRWIVAYCGNWGSSEICGSLVGIVMMDYVSNGSYLPTKFDANKLLMR